MPAAAVAALDASLDKPEQVQPLVIGQQPDVGVAREHVLDHGARRIDEHGQAQWRVHPPLTVHVHNLDVVFSNRPVVAEAGRPWRCSRIDRQSVCLVGPPHAKSRRFRLPADAAGSRFVVPGPSSDIRSQFDVW